MKTYTSVRAMIGVVVVHLGAALLLASPQAAVVTAAARGAGGRLHYQLGLSEVSLMAASTAFEYRVTLIPEGYNVECFSTDLIVLSDRITGAFFRWDGSTFTPVEPAVYNKWGGALRQLPDLSFQFQDADGSTQAIRLDAPAGVQVGAVAFGRKSAVGVFYYGELEPPRYAPVKWNFNGGFHQLDNPGAWPLLISPWRINNHGDYLALESELDETGTVFFKGTFLQKSDGTIHKQDFAGLEGLDLNDSASVILVKRADATNPEDKGYVWDGNLHELAGSGVFPLSINDDGQIIGWEYDFSTPWPTFLGSTLWSKRTDGSGVVHFDPVDIGILSGMGRVYAQQINNRGEILIQNESFTNYFILSPRADRLGVDFDRDGVIDVSRTDSNPDQVLVRKQLPWFFWVNDDNDAEETDGNDIPGRDANGQDGTVNGTRDLIDFFPVHLDIAGFLASYAPGDSSVTYKLAQVDSAANFLITDLKPDEAGKYHSDADVARSLGDKLVTQITADGVELDRTFLASIATEDKGIILVEARKETGEPLRLEIWQSGVLRDKIELPLRFAGVETMFRHKNLVAAAAMTPETADRPGAPNWPDELTNDQAFVFVHGYNVNQQQARGWQAEFFKRLWWSGSNAQFWGVTWYGTESQKKIGSGYLTSNYQANVIHAFGTAHKLKAFITDLKQAEGEGFKVNVAGHSLGNMVVSSAISDHDAPIDRYFMLDAAVAAEAYDGEGGDNNPGRVVQPDDATANMPHSEWNREFGTVYPPKLWATNWHLMFKPPMNDARYRLTWRDRFPLRPDTDYFDFYSTGEEVLDYDGADTPSLGFVLLQTAANKLGEVMQFQVPFIGTGQPAGHKSWQYQEQLKGRTITGKVLGSNFGGWGFNSFHFRKSPGGAGGKGPVLTPAVLRPDELTPEMLSQVFTDEVLREDPFFRPGGRWRKVGSWQHDTHTFREENLGLLYDQYTGSAFASRHRDALLARMIPAMSPPAGRIAVPKLTPPNTPSRNFDMNGTDIRPRIGQNPPWPESRTTQDWWHSDLREVAYPYTRGLYEQIVRQGSLRANP